jgi:glycosyltransferase involved in cell wall biosynthesis
MINVSIIVPTRNRDVYLPSTLLSLTRQDYPATQYEIIVVDNGSTDNTKDVVYNFKDRTPGYKIKYIYEPVPGQLSGRHRGAFEAEGNILIFVDDDIEAIKTWLSSIMDTFNNGNVHLVTGPSLPKYETNPPDWINNYFIFSPNRIICPSLSLLYSGDHTIEIDPIHVWGLNYSIRKKTLFDEGGFHPDCIPKKLQCFQGDGETGLCRKMKIKGLKAIYSPKSAVFHKIPRSRLTVNYFKERFYYQGVCDSYTQIRKLKSLSGINVPEYPDLDCQKLSTMNAYDQYKQIIYQHIQNAYVDGFRFHQDAVKKNDTLLKWILRENYFDYRLPQKNSLQTKNMNKPLNGDVVIEKCLEDPLL